MARKGIFLLCLFCLTVPAEAALITSISTSSDDLTDSSGDYDATGAANGEFDPGTTYSLVFHAGGAPDNRYLESVTANGTTYLPLSASPLLVFRRVDNSGVTGTRELIWYDASNSDPTFNINATRSTGMALALCGCNISHGTDNVFDNTASNNKNNIERVDYLYATGLRAANTAQLGFGFAILERGGNDSFKMAAVTGLDAGGAPSSYGALQSFDSSSWGTGLLSMDTLVVRGDSGIAFQPSAFVSGQSLGGIFVSLSDLGLTVGQTFYGYSLFGPDVTPTSHTLTNPSTFPTNTGSSGGLDLAAGGVAFAPEDADPAGFVLPIPEPGSVLLLSAGLALACLAVRRRRR